MADSETVIAPEKKKPGRPKKKVPAVPIEVHGIVEAPVNPEDIMELVYCNPNLFKKLLQLFKQFNVSEVEMLFDKAGLRMFCTDHLQKSNIYTTIDGKCMNLYYCKAPTRICITRADLERILGILGKTHFKITFRLRDDARSVLCIIIKDIEYNSDETFDIDITCKVDDGLKDAAKGTGLDDDTNYPLKFKFAAKHFKNRINNIKKLSATAIIQKVGDGPLQFTCDKVQKINFAGIYNDPDKIELKSMLGADDIFSISVNINYIKPFSNSNIGDDVYIAVDHVGKISFMTYLDKKDIGYACCVKIFTEIVDHRGGR